MSYCIRYRLIDLLEIGTVSFGMGTPVHRFYDCRKVEFMKKHDLAFAKYRNQVIAHLQETGLADAEAMFVVAESAHVGYHLHSIATQELHKEPVSRLNFTAVQVLLFYLDNEHNKTRWQFQLVEPHVITQDACMNIKHWRAEYRKKVSLHDPNFSLISSLDSISYLAKDIE